MKKILKKHTDRESKEVDLSSLAHIDMINKDRQYCFMACHTPAGKYQSAHAIAHAQIEDKNPLMFFVRNNGNIVINPQVFSATQPFHHTEGCMTWSEKEVVTVQRYNMIIASWIEIPSDVDVSIETLKDPQYKIENKRLTGIESMIMQHEIGHFYLDTIYQNG